MLKTEKTVNEKCADLKKEVKNAIRIYGHCTTNVSEFEKYFNYSAEKLKTSWIPKKIRDTLRKMGVWIYKHRRSPIVTVEIRGEGEERNEQ